MSNKLIYVILGFMICGSVSLSQNLAIKAEFGLGIFNMNDLKEFQTSQIPPLGVKIESLSKFPPYIGYGASLIYFFKSGIGLGIVTDFFSTGGRNYYEDYSGSYNFDLLTHAINLGTVFTVKNNMGKRMNFYFEIQQGLKNTRLILNEKLVTNEPIIDETYTLKSTSWWIKPVFRPEYEIFDFLSAGLSIGYELNLKSKLHLKGNKDLLLTNEDGSNVTANWSGFRFTIYISGNIPIH